MSISNPTPINPSRKFFKSRGSTGHLVWYSKEDQKEYEVKLPFRFIVLDQLATMTGYSKQLESGLWSNEVRSTKTDELVVMAKGMEVQRGLYGELADAKNKGAKYAQSVYIAYQEPSGEDYEWVIGNIKMAGAALGSWIDFRKSVNVEHSRVGVRLKGYTEDKNGATTFYVPQFEAFETTDTSWEVAVDLDHELQGYLRHYLVSRPNYDEQIAEQELVDEINTDLVDDEPDYDVDQSVSTQLGKHESKDVVLEDIDDKPIDLSEIPF